MIVKLTTLRNNSHNPLHSRLIIIFFIKNKINYILSKNTIDN
ncbi:hypothetical protein SeSB_A3072 [Salmonella enterica subsp. enterica serovar Schwarzengrund str. SL480]|uniref:Uncharacterized protein n=1 Tax=Salmonella schwarzengrund (strain CVM19633) TaxID=439843 RepID=A0A0N1QZD8_SALSV|nr:hypothetical protein SeSA_A2903 [Salmonella enterica subsp. enterica serovar Schwarzengrund str. CVM19633]EDY27906.1 hypothetical protein SeSB_A3072 [Salmonella enterica subsp. enterica serovar Schwarzengrund str. SL480]